MPVVGECEQHVGEKVGTFEPPMAEQLGVEGCDDGADSAGLGGVLGEQLADDATEVLGMLVDFAGNQRGIVAGFVGHRGLLAGDAMVAQATSRVLEMELEVLSRAGVADDAGPDLLASAWVPAEGGDAR